jgi:hypothetical protein
MRSLPELPPSSTQGEAFLPGCRTPLPPVLRLQYLRTIIAFNAANQRRMQRLLDWWRP